MKGKCAMISHELKCAFIHIPKTGGSSMELILDSYSIEKYFDSEMHPFPHFKQVGLVKHQLVDSSDVGLGIADMLTTKFEEYFKFSIVRKPWDRIASLFHFRKERTQLSPEVTFECYLKNLSEFEKLYSHWVRPQIDWLLLDGKVAVDYIGRFEDLEKSWITISKKLRINYQPLPWLKKTKRVKDYREYYNDELRDIVGKWFERDIFWFDYKF